MRIQTFTGCSDITSDKLFRNLETSRNIRDVGGRKGGSLIDELDGGKLDILVRTSDVKRLSDFMMWQVSDRWSCQNELTTAGIRGHSIALRQDILAGFRPYGPTSNTAWMAAESLAAISWLVRGVTYACYERCICPPQSA